MKDSRGNRLCHTGSVVNNNFRTRSMDEIASKGLRQCGDYVEFFSQSKRKVYYYNLADGSSVWSKPVDWNLPDLTATQLDSILRGKQQQEQSSCTNAVTETGSKSSQHTAPIDLKRRHDGTPATALRATTSTSASSLKKRERHRLEQDHVDTAKFLGVPTTAIIGDETVAVNNNSSIGTSSSGMLVRKSQRLYDLKDSSSLRIHHHHYHHHLHNNHHLPSTVSIPSSSKLLPQQAQSSEGDLVAPIGGSHHQQGQQTLRDESGGFSGGCGGGREDMDISPGSSPMGVNDSTDDIEEDEHKNQHQLARHRGEIGPRRTATVNALAGYGGTSTSNGRNMTQFMGLLLRSTTRIFQSILSHPLVAACIPYLGTLPQASNIHLQQEKRSSQQQWKLSRDLRSALRRALNRELRHEVDLDESQHQKYAEHFLHEADCIHGLIIYPLSNLVAPTKSAEDAVDQFQQTLRTLFHRLNRIATRSSAAGCSTGSTTGSQGSTRETPSGVTPCLDLLCKGLEDLLQHVTLPTPARKPQLPPPFPSSILKNQDVSASSGIGGQQTHSSRVGTGYQSEATGLGIVLKSSSSQIRSGIEVGGSIEDSSYSPTATSSLNSSPSDPLPRINILLQTDDMVKYLDNPAFVQQKFFDTDADQKLYEANMDSLKVDRNLSQTYAAISCDYKKLMALGCLPDTKVKVQQLLIDGIHQLHDEIQSCELTSKIFAPSKVGGSCSGFSATVAGGSNSNSEQNDVAESPSQERPETTAGSASVATG